ncbi:glycosyltransferase family 2 protein [Chrysiogenes arsenatis]|uniref:glycosyltransferase family 2 protein n=1 Tax=Chrysiogenes arsenatis TaxID=309797 RepID=UPI000485CEF8|nr:glycosyltransferase family 2 protein [Chrysiogenes arsenatis]
MSDTSALQALQAHRTTQCSIGKARLPRVSLIITNYNYADFLRECIESCLTQDYPYYEVIVVDDNSTDTSQEILAQFREQVTVMAHTKNQGQLAAFFSGLEVASGEFIVFVDADDFLDADAVSAHLSLHLFEKPPVAFTCLRNRQVSARSELLNDFHMDMQNNSCELAYIAPRVIHTPTWSWTTTSAMMFRTDVLRLIQTKRTEEFRVCADYYMVHFANLLGGSMLFDRAKVNYRRHGKNNFSKNFLIGGHRPTGNSKYHTHPSQHSLQIAILEKLIQQREEFEPYYPSLERYAEAILYVAPLSFIREQFTLNKDMLTALMRQVQSVEKQRKWQIREKSLAVRWFVLKNRFQRIGAIVDNLTNLYGNRPTGGGRAQ